MARFTISAVLKTIHGVGAFCLYYRLLLNPDKHQQKIYEVVFQTFEYYARDLPDAGGAFRNRYCAFLASKALACISRIPIAFVLRQLAINNPPRLRRFFVSDQTISRGA